MFGESFYTYTNMTLRIVSREGYLLNTLEVDVNPFKIGDEIRIIVADFTVEPKDRSSVKGVFKVARIVYESIMRIGTVSLDSGELVAYVMVEEIKK